MTTKWKLKWKCNSRQIGNLPKNCVWSWTDTGNHRRNGLNGEATKSTWIRSWGLGCSSVEFQWVIFLLKWHWRVILPVGEKVPYCSVSRETRPVLSVHSAVTLAIRWYNAIQCSAMPCVTLAFQCLILIDNWPLIPVPRCVRVHCLSSAKCLR